MTTLKEMRAAYVDEQLTHPDFDRREAEEIAGDAYLAGTKAALEMAAKAADQRSGMFGTQRKPVDASAKAIASAIRAIPTE